LVCGRFTITLIEDILGRFDVVFTDGSELLPRWNAAPAQDIPVILQRRDERELRLMQWEFQPAWAKLLPNRPPPINARAETLTERAMFRDAVMSTRCIIPADGFFEWQVVPGQKRKQQMYIHLKSAELFGFAGLYTWRREAQGWRGSCAIITTAPNERMAPIHNRMPAILNPQDEATWLGLDDPDPAKLLGCLRPYPAGEMEAYPISHLVSRYQNDEPAVIERLAPSR
jgi:putative SOS response-associated peptidase YedK